MVQTRVSSDKLKVISFPDFTLLLVEQGGKVFTATFLLGTENRTLTKEVNMLQTNIEAIKIKLKEVTNNMETENV